MVFSYSLNYYDHQKGWEYTNSGWYQHIVYTDSIKTHKQAIQWLYDNLDNPEKHCRWRRFEDKLCVKFRYEKNYLWFCLSF